MVASICTRWLRVALPVAVGLTMSTFALAADQDAMSVDVHGGTVTFDAATNVSAISVHGKSTALEGHARVRHAEQGLVIEQMEASVPVVSLATGMGLRDTHMRKYVFTTSDGQMPDVRLEAGNAACVHARAGGREMSCQLAGNLSIRGTLRPFVMTLKVNESGESGGAFQAAGDAVVKLSAYQIERPSQLGVQTADDVKLHLEFTGRPAAASLTAAYRGGR